MMISQILFKRNKKKRSKSASFSNGLIQLLKVFQLEMLLFHKTQQILFVETNLLKMSGIYKLSSGKMYNITNDGGMKTENKIKADDDWCGDFQQNCLYNNILFYIKKSQFLSF